MVNKNFRSYDGLYECTNTIPNKVKMEEKFHDVNEDLNELANVEHLWVMKIMMITLRI